MKKIKKDMASGKKQRSRTYYVKQFLFYIFLVAYIVLFAKALLFKEVSIISLFCKERLVVRNLNLIPFKTIFEYSSRDTVNIWISMMNVIGNVVLFIPLALYFRVYKKNSKVLTCVAFVFAVSLCIEVVQYILGIGYTDIDDIILNTLGGLAGALIYKFFFFLLRDDERVKTAIILLFCLVSACVGIFYFILVNIYGYAIKIL